jgi:hypothetical protein
MNAVWVVFAAMLFAVMMRRMRRRVSDPGARRAGGAALLLTSIAVVALAGPVLAAPHSSKAPQRNPIGNLTTRRLSADLRKAVELRSVASNLNPPLSVASEHDKPLIAYDGCQLEFAQLRSKPCVFGDPSSQTTVVLFGDSHAGAWFPALNAISKQHHWRLLIFVKDACPAEDVNLVRYGHYYTQCPIWRDNSEQQIAALDPALVVVASSQYINGMRPRAGVPGGHGGTWQNAVSATFSFLHHAAERVLYITDVPMLTQPAPDCLSAHRSNAQRCIVSTRTGFRYPEIRADELNIARQQHIDALNANSWFCTSTSCPVIVNDILVYRDAQHMTPQYSTFLAPVLDQAMTPIMAAPGS